MAIMRRNTLVRKQQIVAAARKLIVKKGSEHLTVRAIAKEVNLTEAAIYRHFKNKKQILSFLMNQITTAMIEDIDRALSESTPSLETVHDILMLHLSKIEQARGMSFQIIAEVISFGDRNLSREVYENINVYIGKLKDLITQGVKGGFIRDDLDLDSCAMLLFSMIQGMVNVWALGRYGFDLPEKFETLWALFSESIVKRENTIAHSRITDRANLFV